MDQTEYVDECSQVRRHRSFYNDNDGTTLEQEQSYDIPEEIMATIEDYQGDGLARVTVSADLGSSVSFHSAKAFVSVSVPCNNDADSIDAVHGMLRPFVQDLVAEDHEAMATIRDGIIDPRKAAPKEEPKAQVRQPPKRGGKTVTPKGAKKPSFRR
jgi:hypothetical protein